MRQKDIIANNTLSIIPISLLLAVLLGSPMYSVFTQVSTVFFKLSQQSSIYRYSVVCSKSGMGS